MVYNIKDLFKRGSIRGDTLQIYAYQFLMLGIGLISSIIIARTLGPAGKGILDLFNLLSSFIVEFGMMGFGSGLLYYLANKGRPLSEVHGTGLVFSLVIGIMTAFIGMVGLSIWKSMFPGLKEWIILIAFSLSPISYYILIWSNLMTGINRAVAIYIIGFFFSVVSFIVVPLLWFLDWLTVNTVLILTISTTTVNGLICFGVLYKGEPKLKPSLLLAKGSLGYGLVIYIGVIANALHFKVDQVMLNYWMGTGAVGIYAVSVRWAEMLFLLDNAIIAAALYKITSSSAVESYALTKRLFKAQLLISGVSGILLAVLAYPLILILYGEAYRGAALQLVLLIPGIVAWSVGKILSQYLSYNRGKFWLLTSFAVVGAFTNIILNFFLISRFGISGAAIASSFSYIGVLLLVGIAYKKLQGIPVRLRT